MKESWFIISFLYLALFGFFSFLLFKEQVPKFTIYICYGLAVIAVISLGVERMEARKNEEISNYIARMERQNISRGVAELKDLKKMESEGKATAGDYLHYVVYELQGIRLGMMERKDTLDFITTYFDRVAKIPDYYGEKEWGETEGFIYKHTLSEISNYLSGRGMLNSGALKKITDIFKTERNRLVSAKWKK